MDPHKANSVLTEGVIFLLVVLSACLAFSWKPSLSFVIFDLALLLMSFLLLFRSHYRILPSLLIGASVFVNGITHLTNQPGLIEYLIDSFMN